MKRGRKSPEIEGENSTKIIVMEFFNTIMSTDGKTRRKLRSGIIGHIENGI